MQPSASVSDSKIALASPEELPQDAVLTFSLHTQIPAVLSRDETIEVATTDGSYAATLSVANGGVTLATTKVAVARLNPEKSLGPSAFGPLQFRVTANGVAGDWQPLATLVRLPQLKLLECPSALELACKLSGSNLFLVDSISSDPQFNHPIQVPDGFPGYVLPVPHPIDSQLFIKLRDDPSVISPTALPTQPLPPSADEAAHAVIQHSAARNDVEQNPDTGSNQSTPQGATHSPPSNQQARAPESPLLPQQQPPAGQVPTTNGAAPSRASEVPTPIGTAPGRADPVPAPGGAAPGQDS
jgi:hypothetical protein